MRIEVDWARRGREVAVFTAIGLFLAFIRPYGATAQMPFWLNAVYWTGLVLLGATVGETTSSILARRAPNLPVWAVMLVLSVVTALAVSAALVGIERVVDGGWMPLGYLPSLFGLVWVIAIAMTGLGVLLERSFNGGADHVPDAAAAATFLGRLPVRYRGAELYAVSSEDHYLRIHTDRGEELILMRLADAMRELDGAKGLQTHRSWWVAEAGVADARREGGKLVLVLKSGKEAPVSRTYQRAVREAGLA
ncbi:LytTr DNA-binding domain-containing protein [Hyphomonas johnsonii MHS-2]|uniref:LytTr DNA-binding domain-containing protein n=1 Tax=Hyphomonas johnsonii MHS-2 TaxID=1280950 RepID=A0A059FHA7_9PROT|nr:LytTr DNA-binding domain-containing protein [Hyphomonas johnsonii MHS-2]